MPQPGDTSQLQLTSEESLLDILEETLGGLDDSVRGPFLRQFLQTIAQVDLTEAQSLESWRTTVQRHRELLAAGKTVSLRALLLDVLTASRILRTPVLMEYQELKKLQINAATDSLTGLYNRRLFDEYCDKELNRAKRYGHQLAIVILDLKKLKEVNDVHGHLRGDHVLKMAATTLRSSLRASDSAFRIGGDEFVLLLPQTDAEQADTLCHRLRTQYESELAPMNLGIGVTLDFGIAVFPEAGEKKDDLMSLADSRLYDLKYGRRPKIESSSPESAHEPKMEQSQVPRPITSVPRPGAIPEPAPRVSTSNPPNREQRKWERVSLAGTKAYAVLSDLDQKTARVLDLSYGGVSLLLDRPNGIPTQFNAVLHVPILPPVRVVLRKAYSIESESGRTRVGCSFVA
ncbi:MAG TPA: GGDEF domain-containing protein [Candidatus Acidoferrales bacterium]|nr:GGDEF domain-containing protein [Candidatus Acidoferrales bacterium]